MRPLIDFPSFTVAVKALSIESGTPEYDARDRYLKAAEKHAAALEAAKANASALGEAEKTEKNGADVRFIDEADLESGS